jgi:steroid delta-isomerase-like uncharacterized protein
MLASSIEPNGAEAPAAEGGQRMSTEQNKAVVTSFQEAFSRGDLDACEALLAPDVVVHFPGMPGPLNLAAYREVGAAFLAAFPGLRLETLELIAEGDRVMCREQLVGTHQGPFQGIPATGRPVRIEGISIDRIADGRIAERRVAFDALGLMQQLGALPTPEPAAG